MLAPIEEAATGTAAEARGRGYAAVIGDVIASRRVPRAAMLPRRLQDALERANRRIGAVQPLQPTIGDEFQGVYARVGSALNATLLVRLLLHDLTEVRFGVGWGGFTSWASGRAPYEQDGPAWWSARAAIEAVREQERRPGVPANWQTAVRLPAESPVDTVESSQEALFEAQEYLIEARSLTIDPGLVLEGVVMFRDHVLGMLDDRDVALVLALLDGATAKDAAGSAGISQQAASRRLRENGGYALLKGWELLESAG